MLLCWYMSQYILCCDEGGITIVLVNVPGFQDHTLTPGLCFPTKCSACVPGVYTVGIQWAWTTETHAGNFTVWFVLNYSLN